jgi:uncharacterized protein
MVDLSLFQILTLSGVAFVAGLVDAIAGGGGLLQLPALLAMGIAPHFAFATNKGASVFGALASFRKFLSQGLVDLRWLWRLIAGGLLGSLAGAALLIQVSPQALRPLVLVLLFLSAIAVVALKRPEHEEDVPAVPHATTKATCIATALGAYDGFFGPGTGTFLIVLFSSVLKLSLPKASGNAKAVNLASNIAAVALFSLQGTLLWRVSLPMAVGQILGATLGAKLAIRRGAPLIRLVLLGVVVALIFKLSLDIVKSNELARVTR